MQKAEESLYFDEPFVRSSPPKRVLTPSLTTVHDSETSETSPREAGLNSPEVQDRAGEARRKSVENRRAEALQKVFAVRLPPPSTGYGWEIRRFGSIVLSRSEAEFPTSAEAKVAGEAAMAAGAGQR